MASNCNRKFNEFWKVKYFFIEKKGTPTCLICYKSVAVNKESNVRRYYEDHHKDNHNKYLGEERVLKFENLFKTIKTTSQFFINKHQKIKKPKKLVM